MALVDDLDLYRRRRVAQGRERPGEKTPGGNAYYLPEQDKADAAEIWKQANKRRQPRKSNDPIDAADRLLREARQRELASMGVGHTRSAAFATVANPLPATASLFRY